MFGGRTREILTIAAVALVATTAGCGFILGDQALEREASAATVSESALSETGYEEVNVSERSIEQHVSVAGQNRTVRAINYVAQYERSVDLGPLGQRRAAVFGTFSTPAFEIAGETFNPIDEMSTRDLVERTRSQYEEFDVGQRVDRRNVTALDEQVTVDKYEGTATLEGSQIEVYVHVTEPVRVGDDFVVAIAVYPRQIDSEQEKVDALLSGLEHDE